jgi:hypothetical protein
MFLYKNFKRVISLMTGIMVRAMEGTKILSIHFLTGKIPSSEKIPFLYTM